MSAILFATWDGGGNVPPALGIAGALERRGHTARVIGHDGVAAAVAAAGLDFTPYRTAKPFTSKRNNPPWVVAATWADAGLGDDVVAEARALGADLVVVDCLLPGAMAALARAGIRYVVLEHLFDGFLQVLRRGPLGGLVRLRGVRWGDALDGAESRLVASLPSIDPGARGSLPANLEFVGPVVTGTPASPGDRTILVSLSTYAFAGMPATLQRILDACADLPARVIVTTGPAVDPGALRLPANAEAHRWLVHADVMPRVSMVVGHGGHSTTMLALAHDLPLLILPMHPLVDQPMVGKAVERAGAGRRLPKRASARAIRPAVEELLGAGAHRVAAAGLGAEIRAAAGAETAATRIAALVSEGAVDRPEG